MIIAKFEKNSLDLNIHISIIDLRFLAHHKSNIKSLDGILEISSNHSDSNKLITIPLNLNYSKNLETNAIFSSENKKINIDLPISYQDGFAMLLNKEILFLKKRYSQISENSENTLIFKPVYDREQKRISENKIEKPEIKYERNLRAKK